ncbi:hypothetical protein B4U84_18745 [Westiellopsis prolifica IICB1]|nr:hypothetical protein B4U84_18745 [Westiellopsis prolifica IICB1]
MIFVPHLGQILSLRVGSICKITAISLCWRCEINFTSDKPSSSVSTFILLGVISSPKSLELNNLALYKNN